MNTANTMQYREIQERYLKKRQDEIWAMVRRLTSRPQATPGYFTRRGPGKPPFHSGCDWTGRKQPCEWSPTVHTSPFAFLRQLVNYT